MKKTFDTSRFANKYKPITLREFLEYIDILLKNHAFETVESEYYNKRTQYGYVTVTELLLIDDDERLCSNIYEVRGNGIYAISKKQFEIQLGHPDIVKLTL